MRKKISLSSILLGLCLVGVLVESRQYYSTHNDDNDSDKPERTLKHEIHPSHKNNHHHTLVDNDLRDATAYTVETNEKNLQSELSLSSKNKSFYTSLRGCYQQKPAHLKKPDQL